MTSYEQSRLPDTTPVTPENSFHILCGIAQAALKNAKVTPTQEWGPAHHRDDYVAPEIPVNEDLTYSA